MKPHKYCPYCKSVLQGDSIEGMTFSCMEDCRDERGLSPFCYSLSYKTTEDTIEQVIMTTKDYVIRYNFETEITHICKNSGGWYDEILRLNYLVPIEYNLETLNDWAKELHKLAAFS